MNQRNEKALSYKLAGLILLSSEVDRLINVSKSLLESYTNVNCRLEIQDEDKRVFFEAHQLLLDTQSDICRRINDLQLEIKNLSIDRIAAKVANSNS